MRLPPRNKSSRLTKSVSLYQLLSLQLKLFSRHPIFFRSFESLASDVLIANARAAGQHVVRVLDLDTSSLVAKAVVNSLVSIPINRILVDYFLAGVSPEDADEKVRAMSYPRVIVFRFGH